MGGTIQLNTTKSGRVEDCIIKVMRTYKKQSEMFLEFCNGIEEYGNKCNVSFAYQDDYFLFLHPLPLPIK